MGRLRLRRVHDHGCQRRVTVDAVLGELAPQHGGGTVGHALGQHEVYEFRLLARVGLRDGLFEQQLGRKSRAGPLQSPTAAAITVVAIARVAGFSSRLTREAPVTGPSGAAGFPRHIAQALGVVTGDRFRGAQNVGGDDLHVGAENCRKLRLDASHPLRLSPAAPGR